jgi:membrane protease YdiL (CAAX protease family)
MEENQEPVKEDRIDDQGDGRNEAYVVPWSIADTWTGVILLILLSIGMFVALFIGVDRKFLQNLGVLFLEMVYLLPVVLIFLWRRIHWRHLGFGAFRWSVIGLGCGLLIGGYAIILAHNALLYFFRHQSAGRPDIRSSQSTRVAGLVFYHGRGDRAAGGGNLLSRFSFSGFSSEV